MNRWIFVAALVSAVGGIVSRADALPQGQAAVNRPGQAQEDGQPLTAEQKQTVKAILSRYKEASLTAADARVINDAFRAAGLRGGADLQQAIIDAGFDARKISTLAPPPGRPSGPNPERPAGAPEPSQSVGEQPRESRGSAGGRYSIEQATSDRAQLHTIAFDGLAFLTGDFAADTFLPPGKVSDYFGFQYMRDIDAREGGHNTSFLTIIANNMLAILDSEQKARLVALAREQGNDIRLFAERRLPLIQAFRRNLEGSIPPGSKGLDRDAVMKYSAALYELDGRLAYQRAKAMGAVILSLTAQQKAALAKLKFGDSRTWPAVTDQLDKRSMPHDVNVAVMTYASEMFAWYAGSLEADTYFCPERHGMYFGGFGMKTAPAMGKQDYSISTTLTGDSGEAFLAALTPTQREAITNLVDLQRKDLAEIVTTRREISAELRRFQKDGVASQDKVLALSKRYGELDGEMSYLYATAFAQVGKTLTSEQKAKLAAMRTTSPSDPKGPFLYSDPIAAPKVENSDFLFGTKQAAK